MNRCRVSVCGMFKRNKRDHYESKESSKRGKDGQKKLLPENKMASPSTSVISLNVNGLNALIKRHKLAKQI